MPQWAHMSNGLGSTWTYFFQFSGLALIFMPVLFGFTRRLLFTMANETYKAGTHSMAFVTVPNEEVAKKLAGY